MVIKGLTSPYISGNGDIDVDENIMKIAEMLTIFAI